MKNPVCTGAGVAIITPMYEDGSINFDELGRIVEDQIARGTDAIVICGTTGECSTMTDEEQLYQHIPQAKFLIQLAQQKYLDTGTGLFLISIQMCIRDSANYEPCFYHFRTSNHRKS